MTFSGESFNPPGELRDRHDRVDAAVLDTWAISRSPSRKLIGTHRLARQQRSVETGDEPHARRQQQPDARARCLRRKNMPQPRRHRGELLVRVLAAVVDDRLVAAGWARGVGEERFEEHRASHITHGMTQFMNANLKGSAMADSE